MKNESIIKMGFDSKGSRDSTSNGAGGTYCAQSSEGCNAWTVNDNFVNGTNSGTVLKDAELNTYLKETYLNSITANKDKIKTTATWSIGAVTNGNADLAGQIVSENKTTWQGSIALPTLSEYLRANTNANQCGNLSLNNNNSSSCHTTNWMYSIVQSSEYLWLLSPNDSEVFNVYGVSGSAGRVHRYNSYYKYGVAPTLYLTSDIILTGAGESGTPYVITN